MRILGISCFYHDSAAALIVDGDIVPVYTKSYPAGPVSLGSVEVNVEWREMYLILLAEQNGAPTAAPPIPPGNPVIPGTPCPLWTPQVEERGNQPQHQKQEAQQATNSIEALTILPR